MTDTQTLFWEQITMRFAFVIFIFLASSIATSYALDPDSLSGTVAECVAAREK